jgi:hypothetical protein
MVNNGWAVGWFFGLEAKSTLVIFAIVPNNGRITSAYSLWCPIEVNNTLRFQSSWP